MFLGLRFFIKFIELHSEYWGVHWELKYDLIWEEVTSLKIPWKYPFPDQGKR